MTSFDAWRFIARFFGLLEEVMRHSLKIASAAAALFCAAGNAPAFAQSQNAFDHANPNASFLRGAPGPLAGAGLPFLIGGVVAAYRVVRRKNCRDQREAAGRG